MRSKSLKVTYTTLRAVEQELEEAEELEEEPADEEAGEEAELIVDPDDAPTVIRFLENLLGLLKEESDEEMEMEPEEEMEMEPEMEMEMEPEEEEEEAPLQMEAMVNKIAARVAKRILSKK